MFLGYAAERTGRTASALSLSDLDATMVLGYLSRDEITAIIDAPDRSTAGVRISMDGRGRALDNVFVERLWRSVKDEEVYLKDYGSVPEARAGLGTYFAFNNTETTLTSTAPETVETTGSTSVSAKVSRPGRTE